MLGSVKIRRFCSQDLAFVEAMLVATCFPPTRALPTVSEALQFPHAARWLEPAVNASDLVMVAELEEGGLVAAAVGRWFERPDPAWGTVAPDVPELALAVATEHRGRGIGELLLRGWIDELRVDGVPSASLTVSVHNECALRLYERCGFRELRRDERRVLMHGVFATSKAR